MVEIALDTFSNLTFIIILLSQSLALYNLPDYLYEIAYIRTPKAYPNPQTLSIV